jgi:glutamate dehydrogenase/leucine dehydrogenase
MLVCIHSTRLGPAGGGTRMNWYAQPFDRLREGVLYAPDFAINAGGVLYALDGKSLGRGIDTVETGLERIGDPLLEIYARAESEGIGTNTAAEDLARSRTSGEQWNAQPESVACSFARRTRKRWPRGTRSTSASRST